MDHFDAAAYLSLLLTERTGSCCGTLKLYHLDASQQKKHFGRVLTPWKHNSFTIDGAAETVLMASGHRVFGRMSHKDPETFTFRELGD